MYKLVALDKWSSGNLKKTINCFLQKKFRSFTGIWRALALVVLALILLKCETMTKPFFFYSAIFRSSHPGVFLGKGVLKICSKFTEEHPCRSVISIKFKSNFIEIAHRHPVNLLHIFRKPFPRNTSGRLLLNIIFINLETKLKAKFLFSCHVDRSHVMCSSVRRANSIDSIRRLPVKAYLSQSPSLIFKYVGFECQVKLIFFPGLLFWASSQFKYSRTLSETIDKFVLLMWGVRTIRGTIIADETTKSKICIPVWPFA